MHRALGLWDRIFGRLRRGSGRILKARGSYRFLKLLGKGGMGEVWLADKMGAAQFSKLVAIKTIRSHRLQDLRILEMFLDEARLVANLVHPNIVQVYQLGQNRREVFIVMEYVFGRTLLDLLEALGRQGRRLPIDVGTHVISRVCHGLHYAHRKHSREGRHLQIVHRDICPSNILISFRGIPKLTDFGVAKAITSKVDDEGNVVWGKYPYMAPEAALRQGTDARSDVYSLGLVLYEMFTGEVAHAVDSTRALKVALESEEPEDRDVRQLVPNIPDRLARIIAKATEPDPRNRHQTAKELAADIEQFQLSHFMFPEEDSIADFLATVFPEAEKYRWW